MQRLLTEFTPTLIRAEKLVYKMLNFFPIELSKYIKSFQNAGEKVITNTHSTKIAITGLRLL